MNETVSKLLLVGDKFVLEMHLKKLVLLIVLLVHLPETKRELKNLCRKEIQMLFTKMNLIKLVLNMIWLMANQKT